MKILLWKKALFTVKPKSPFSGRYVTALTGEGTHSPINESWPVYLIERRAEKKAAAEQSSNSNRVGHLMNARCAHLTGSFEVKIDWNSDTAISISAERINYKGVDVLWDDVTVRSSASNETNLSFAVFVPDQTSEWAEGMVGLTEKFNITFHPSGSSFKGTFQRTNEGPLSCSGKRTKTGRKVNTRARA